MHKLKPLLNYPLEGGRAAGYVWMYGSDKTIAHLPRAGLCLLFFYEYMWLVLFWIEAEIRAQLCV